MNTIYEWLYDNYASELQKVFRRNETEAIEQLSQKIPLSTEQKIYLADCMANLRLCCGTESFALGVQMGLRLTQDIDLVPPTAS